MSELSCCRHHQIVFTRQGCDICTMQYALRQLEAERDALREALTRPVSDAEAYRFRNHYGGTTLPDYWIKIALELFRESRLAAATKVNAPVEDDRSTDETQR